MADVSVEFGAVDTGLQNNLKAIQNELAALENTVKTADLSTGELKKTFRDIAAAKAMEERLKALGDESSGAATKLKDLEDQMRRAEAITKANRTALEIYGDEVDQLQKLLDAGLISQKTYAAAIEKAEAALKAATPQTEEARRANEELQASLKKAEAETKALSEEQRKAEAITKANRSATQIYNDEVEELQKHLAGGRISLETFEKAVAKADAKLAAANPQVDGLGKNIKATGDKSEKMGDQAGIGFGKLAAAVGVGQIAAKAFTAVLDSAFSAVRNTIQGFTDALDLGGRLSDLSASTGETAGNLLLLERAFDTSGAGAEKVGPAIAKMQKSIQDASEGSLEAEQSLGLMGLTAADLEGKLPNEQLKVLASGITSIDDPTQRAAAAMGIFGRSGADLIPLLTNLEGELGEARDTVGSMADIMDRRNSVFDAVADRFKIIQEKVRDFAAGILDRAIPAIDAITSALSRIDAAAIGQQLAGAFLGGQDAMKGFQSAVDAIKVGKASLAFEAFFESAKLQAMETGNALINNFSAAFNTVAQIIANVFRSDGPTLLLITSAFDFVAGYIKEKVAGSLADTLSGLGPAFSGIRDSLQQSADAGATAAELALQRIPVAAGLAADDIGTNLAGSVDLFQKNLANANTEFFNTADQAAKVAALQDEITAAVADTNAERAAGTADTEAELARRTEIRAAAEAAAAADKAARTELITLETALNEAKAAGNEELTKSLEKELESKKAKEEIKALTEEYVKTLGLDADEAARLATNFVNAKNAAAGVNVDKTSVTEAKQEAAKAAEAAKSFATWLDYIKGVDPAAPVKSLTEQSRDAKKEITAFGEYIGVDLKNKSFPDVARKLGIDTMGMTGKEQMDAILSYIDEQRKTLVGIDPVDKKASENSIASIQSKIKETLGATPQTITLDASNSIEQIKRDLTQEIDLALSSSKGSAYLAEIRSFVESIKDLVGKIEPKLPTHALA